MSRLVREFHEEGGLPIDAASGRTLRERIGPMLEEFGEANEAIMNLQTCYRYSDTPGSAPVLHALKELMDVQYTIQSLCTAMGWDHVTAYRKICESNLSKVRGGAVKDANGKITKTSKYMEPNLAGCVPLSQLAESGGADE
jgi:hypothetical protein